MADRQSDEGKPGHGFSGDGLRARIGATVLRELGHPAEFLAVQVRPLWGGHYRVNVLVGQTAASAAVAHSYFLEADGDGTVLKTIPALARRY